MNIVIIAAGKGSRIFKKLKKNKQLIDLEEGVLLKILVENAIKAKFEKIYIVVGFKSKNIINALKNYPQVIFIYNKYFATREMFYSIICGLKKTNADTLVSYSDIYYNYKLLNIIIKKKSKNILLPVNLSWKKIWKIRGKNIYDDAETLKYNNNLELIEIGKKFKKKEEPKSQFMGLIFIPQKKISQIIKYYNKNKLQKMQTTDVLNLLLRKKEKVNVLPTKSFWYEFDDYEDLHNYNKKFK
jgi:choline kinase